MQAETLASAYRLWRRNWRGRGKELTAGALVWQLNDCWPVTSWAIADYFLRPKPSYYTVKRELATYTVGMTRKETKRSTVTDSDAFFEIDTLIEIWGTNSTLESKDATLLVEAYDLEAGLKSEAVVKEHVTLSANASTELWKGSLQLFGQPLRTLLSQRPKALVVSARLLGSEGSVLARYSNW